MYEQNKNLIAIKVRPITEDLKGFIYPIFYYEHDTFIPVSKEDFPNNNLVIVHQNKIRESFGFKGTPLRFIIRERKES